MNKNVFIAIIIILIIGTGTYAWFIKHKSVNQITNNTATSSNQMATSTNQTATSSNQVATSSNAVEYVNTQYGFRFVLPEDWKGYSIVASTWEGYAIGPNGDVPSERGPEISIRNPKWTQKKPYQDIPIMIFTLAQWDETQRDKFHIGAAPINPLKLNFNARYVFALPARYNYAFPAGFEEVDKIISGHPLKPLEPVSFNSLPANDQILLCAGVPNGSTEQVTETTRLFVNLPKDIYPDKDHNLQFKTLSGNATSTWISNAGTYGEAFQSTSDCWSYFYEMDGHGELGLTAKSAVKGQPDYGAKFIIGSNQ